MLSIMLTCFFMSLYLLTIGNVNMEFLIYTFQRPIIDKIREYLISNCIYHNCQLSAGLARRWAAAPGAQNEFSILGYCLLTSCTHCCKLLLTQ